MYSTGSKTYLPRRLRAIFHNASVYIYSLRVVSRRPAIKIKTTEQPLPLLLSLLFFSSRSPFFSPFFFIHALFPSLWLLHRIITRMQIYPLDRYPRRVYPFFFLPPPRQREILLGERRGIRERIRWSISIFSRAYYLFTIFFEKTFNPPSSRGESRWYDINGLLRYKIS